MRMLKAQPLIVVVLLLAALSSYAKPKVKTQVPDSSFPTTLLQTVEGAQRFQNPDYFGLLASGGIKSVDSKALFARSQAAVRANESYKALYFARLFTEAHPEIAAGWNNRAALAKAIGLTEEAAGSDANAKNVAHPVKVPLGILPGNGLKTKPTSLADWAAAMALLSDGLAEKEGKGALVAIKDSVSGIHQATAEEIAEQNQDAKDAGVSPSGAWATPEPIKVEHVLGNVFSLRSADPMHFKSTNTGGMFAAMLMGGLAGMQQNPVARDQISDEAAEMAGRASQVPSHYAGGSYTIATYPDGKEAATVQHPQPSGEDETVGLPVPLLWASGGSTTAFYSGRWIAANQKPYVKRITASDVGKDVRARRTNVPNDLRFPKFMTLCTGTANCSNPLTLMELLLTHEDIEAFAPALAASFDESANLRNAYKSDKLVVRTAYAGGRMAAIDKDGTLYLLSPEPTNWLVPSR
jgi:hypothetical protein